MAVLCLLAFCTRDAMLTEAEGTFAALAIFGAENAGLPYTLSCEGGGASYWLERTPAGLLDEGADVLRDDLAVINVASMEKRIKSIHKRSN